MIDETDELEFGLAQAARVLRETARDLYDEAERAEEGRLVSPHLLAAASRAVGAVDEFMAKLSRDLQPCPRRLHSRSTFCSKPLSSRNICPDHGLIRERQKES